VPWPLDVILRLNLINFAATVLVVVGGTGPRGAASMAFGGIEPGIRNDSTGSTT
jgi:hypothetical protein